MFNRVVTGNDLKWPAWDGIWKGFDRQQTLRFVDEMRAKGYSTKGHVLSWGYWHAPPVMRKLGESGDQEAMQKMQLDHIRGIVAATRGKLDVWDVVNEHYTYSEFTHVLGDDAAVEWFKVAHQTDPAARLFWNDTHALVARGQGRLRHDHTVKWLTFLQSRGAPIHGVGEEAHIGVGNILAPEELLAGLDAYAALGLDIEATEFDFDIDDPGDPEQQRLQADYVRDFLTVFFSHPKVTGVIYWTPFIAKWKPRAALTDKDGRLRPHGEAWMQLVTRTWRTDASTTSGSDGRAGLRGYLGDYRIEARSGGHEAAVNATLGPEGTSVRVVLP